MSSGGIMRTRITLIVGLSTVFLFLSIYGTAYVNGQSSTLNSTENLDPFVLKGSSNTANTDNSNDPAQADDESSTNSNSDDDESSTNSNREDDESSTNSNREDDESSTNSKNDDSDKDGSDDDKSS